MDMLLLGETVVANDAGQSIDGYWMPAGGNDGVAGFEVFYLSAANGFEVILDTKKSDEADTSATQIGSLAVSSTTPQNYKFDVANAKDLVRYRVYSRGAAVMHVQFAQPLWQPN